MVAATIVSRMRAARKTTIYDLSRLSGCSASTVSAVLNGSWERRRISAETAQTILALAADHHYKANRQAKGLRTASSGLVGLLLPLYDNRFFSNVAQIFEAKARALGLTPLISSTARDPGLERSTLEDLISHSLDALFICGATEPDALDDICRRTGLPHINIDLPGTRSHSVISDNRAGAERLARQVIAEARKGWPDLPPEEVCFFGGRNDLNSADRLAGFLAARRDELGDIGDRECFDSGYSAQLTRRDVDEVIARRGRLPRVVFFASTLNFEGFLGVMESRPPEFFADLVVGCVDYDPFGSFLPPPVWMMEQDVEAMLGKAFELLPRWDAPPELHVVASRLIPPRSALSGPQSDRKAQ